MERGKTMKAKDYLQQVSKLDRMIQNKLIERCQWKSIALSTGSCSSEQERVQSSGNKSRMEDAVIRLIEMEEEIDRYIDELIDTKKDVIRTIEKLPVAEYDVLHKVYIQFKTLDEAAAMMDKSYSWATTVHGRALKHVQEILERKVVE